MNQQSGLEIRKGQELIKRVSGPAKGVYKRMFRYGSLVDFSDEEEQRTQRLVR